MWLLAGSCAANTRLATGSYVPEIGTASVDSDATVLAKSGTQITQKSSAGPTIFDDDANTYYEITQIGYSAVNITFDTAVQVSSLSIAWSPNIASQFSIKVPFVRSRIFIHADMFCISGDKSVFHSTL